VRFLVTCVFVSLLLLSTFALVDFTAVATSQPLNNLLVSLPAGTVVGVNSDPWLDEGWLLNISEHYGNFVVRINETVPSPFGTFDIHLIIALNEIAYNNLVDLYVNTTFPERHIGIPKTSFQYGVPRPYNVWSWPDDVYPTWFNDTLVNLGVLQYYGIVPCKDVTVSVRFSNATSARMHFDAYGSTFCHSPTTPENIVRNRDSNDSTVIFSPKIVIPPQADFTWCPFSPQVCETVTFNASTSTPGSAPIVPYKWDFGDGNVTSVSSPIVTHHYMTFGTFTVTLNVTNSDSAWDTESKPITVRAHPHAVFTYSPHYPQVNETVTFNASASTPDGGTIVSYEWDFGDSSPHESGMIVAHNYTAIGEYLVTLNVTDSEAKWATASKTVKVGLPPTPPHADFTWCPLSPQVGDTVTFNGSISTPDGGTIVSYEWDFGDSSPHQFGVVVTHSYSTFGNYTVTLNVTDSEDEWDTESKNITVRGHPHAEFTWSPQIPYRQQPATFNASASTPDGGYIVSYAWNFGDGNTTSVTSPIIIHRYNVSATYQVTLNVTDSECKWDAKSKNVTVVTPPPEPEFAVKIEGKWTWPGNEYNITAPAYCKTFRAEVWVTDVKDLYAYEFWLSYDKDWIQLENHEIRHIHTSDYVVLESVDNLNGLYKQAVTAVSPAKGFNNSASIASFLFHVIKDACYPDNFNGRLMLTEAKMSNSCGGSITPSREDGYFNILTLKPKISINSGGNSNITKSVVGDTFKIDVVITDIVRMKSFCLDLTWNCCLETDYQNIEVTKFLPPPYSYYQLEVFSTEAKIWVKIPCDKPAINGTGTLVRITFRVKDPWGTVYSDPPYYNRSRVPPYINLTKINPELHGFVPDICISWINITGYIDVYCPEYREMQLWNATHGVSVTPWNATTYTAKGLPIPYNTLPPFRYQFRPVPGDINLDGHADIEDLAAIAKAYGKYPSYVEGGVTYYTADFDLTGDHVIDVFDAVIVAKNFCRTQPDPTYPQP
jgi:PKD repeat protein